MKPRDFTHRRVRERHETLLERLTEELQQMEAEYHVLNVDLIHEELKGEQTEP